MSVKDVEDLRFCSSAVDAFFNPPTAARVAAQGSGKVRVASLQTLTGFQMVGADTLVHLSQKDFWKIGQDQDGFFIERLVDDETGPIKG